MELSAILLLIGLVLLIGLYVYDPFTRRAARAVSQSEQDLSALQAEQERILSALSELDMDYALGKVPEEDYPVQRAALVKAGVDVLRRMDALQAAAPETSVDDRLEAAIADRRAQKDAAEKDDDLEAMIARRRAQRREKTSGFCPQCGRPVLKSDKFCPHCGFRL